MAEHSEQGAVGVPAAVFDPARLAAVHDTGLIGTGPEEVLDRLASLAATLVDAPLAFITLVDSERSWYKSFVGGTEDAQRWGLVEESFCQYVLGEDGPCIFGDVRSDERARGNSAIVEMGIAAWAGFPVRAPDGAVLGTFCVADARPREWTARDVHVLETLAAAASAEVALRVSLREEREQRAKAEAATAELAASHAELQRVATRAEALAVTLGASLLPPRLSPVPGLDVAARYRSAAPGQEVTGDFYDLFPAGRNNWSAVIADVCGKGPEAAALTAEVRYSMRAEAAHTTVPSKVLAAVNDILHSNAALAERFATAAYASLRRRGETWRVSLCLAGHPHPLLRRADGEVLTLGEPGLPLGLFPDASLRDRRVTLHPGDVLLLYTDGLTEARRGSEEFGMERVAQIMADTDPTSAEGLVARLHNEVTAFAEGGRDDTALVAMVAR